MALTNTAVRKAKPNKKSYTLSDTDGLSLHVAPESYKNWSAFRALTLKKRAVEYAVPDCSHLQ